MIDQTKHIVKMSTRADAGGSAMTTVARSGDEDVPLFISTTREELLLSRKDMSARSQQQTFLASEAGGVIITSTRTTKRSGSPPSSPSSPVLARFRKSKWNEGDESTLPTFLSVSDIISGRSVEDDKEEPSSSSIGNERKARAIYGYKDVHEFEKQFMHREKLHQLSDRHTTSPTQERSRHSLPVEKNNIEQQDGRKAAGANGFTITAICNSIRSKLMACNCDIPGDGRNDDVEYSGAITSKIMACATQCNDEGAEEIVDHTGLIIEVPQCATNRCNTGDSTVVTRDDDMSSLSGASYYRFGMSFRR